MADLIAIGYPDMTTAQEAMDEVGQLQSKLIIQGENALSNEAQAELQNALHGSGE